MSTLLLSILLIVLVGLGLLMGPKAIEHFENPSTPDLQIEELITVSPAMANLMANPMANPMGQGPVPQVDTLGRDKEIQDATEEAADECVRKCHKKENNCPKCKKCPDMSKYISRQELEEKYIARDSIPCWNCTL
jgi:hypothetical protein